MTVLTDTQVITASGGLVELGYSQITSPVTISSSNELAPNTVISAVTVVCDGSPILVEFCAPYLDLGTATGNWGILNVWLDGVDQGRISQTYTAVAAGGATQAGAVKGVARLTPSAGSHTVSITGWRNTANCSVGAGAGGIATTRPAFLRVSKIVTATQWPAVTTGTIICTSGTRPASPFAGQEVYETDTGRSRYWNGSAWVGRGWEKIGDFTNNSTSLSYSSIPQDYKHLQVRWVAQSNRSGIANTGGRFRWNGLSSANYQITYNIVAGSTVSTAGGGSNTWGYVGQIPAGSRANDNYIAECIIDFPFYSASNRIRTAHSRMSGFDGTNVLLGNCGATNDSSIAAITSIQLYDDVAGTLGPRSSAELWGLWS